MRSLIPFLFCLVLMPIRADEPLVFISAFQTGDAGAIHACGFDVNTGQLQLKHRTTDVEYPFFFVISADSRFLYAIDSEQFGDPGDEFIAAFAVQGRTGELKKLNRHSARGTASCYVDVDQSGRTVVVANYSSGSVAALPVDENGALGEATSFFQHSGSSVDPDRQDGPYAHSIVISPDNRFALAADLGVDRILIYRLDPASGRLEVHREQPSAALPPGSGPRHLIFHPNGQAVYVINELKNTMTFFSYAADAGRLTQRQTISTLPEDFSGTSHTADLKITSNGRFLYGTNRGHDSIAIFRIADDGRLSLVSIEPSRGQGPQNLLITPDDRWLLCANMSGSNVAVFAIDADSGALTATGDPVSVPMPSCIRWLP